MVVALAVMAMGCADSNGERAGDGGPIDDAQPDGAMCSADASLSESSCRDVGDEQGMACPEGFCRCFTSGGPCGSSDEECIGDVECGSSGYVCVDGTVERFMTSGCEL